MKIDLHIHSTASDGQFTPTQLVKAYKRKEFAAISICDHDSVSGTTEALKAGKKYNLKVISGAELSTTHNKKSLHILGYNIDHNYKPLKDRCRRYHKAREKRARAVVKKLKKIGFKLTYKKVDELSEGIVTRTHIAEAVICNPENKDLIRKYVKGQVNVSSFIAALIMPGKPAYVAYKKRTAKQDIELIHKAGGLAFLAHPVIVFENYPNINKERFIKNLMKIGLDGMEVYTGYQKKSDDKIFAKIASDLNLLVSGGSDFHGEVHNQKLGSKKFPGWILKQFE